MIPILYESNETEFTSNGLGRLRDAIRVEVTEERNGIFEAEFDYPVSGAHYEDIVPGRIIAVEHDESGNIEPFDICSYSRPINGVVTFKAQHVSYRLTKSVVSGTNITSLLMAMDMLESAVPNMGFTFGTDRNEDGYMAAADGVPRSVRECLGGVEGSILDAYGGEYEFNKFHVHLWESRGNIRDFTIRYGKNMTDYNEDGDYSGTFTAVIPYWTSENITVKGDMVTSGATSFDGRERCIALDLTDKFEAQPTKAQVESMALNYLLNEQPALPSTNIKVDFIRLQDSDEYHKFSNLQKCGLCDSIKVIFPQYNIERYFKIVRVVWDVLLERYIEMELGNLSTTLAEALGVSGGGASATTRVESGNIAGSSVSSNSYKDYEVTFSKSFPSVPTVIACFQSTSTAGAFGNCTLGVVSTSATGFTVRVFNGDASGRAPNINWLAIKA